MDEPETVVVTLPADLLRRVDREIRFCKRAAGQMTREMFIRGCIEQRRDTRRQDADHETAAARPQTPAGRRLYPVCHDPAAETDLSTPR